MHFPFLKKNKQEKPSQSSEEVYIALDIGTEFVKTAVFRLNKGMVEIIGFSRVPQHSKAMEGAMIINIDNVVSSCDNGIGRALVQADKVMNQKVPIPKSAIIGISGELVKGVSIVANYERDNPDIPISNEELNEVIENVKEQAFTDSLNDIANEIGTSPSKIKEINSHINSTYIDGIKVDSPEGFTGEEVTYRVYSTFAPSIHINSTYQIAERLGLEVLGIEVQPYAVSRAFKGSHKSDFSSVFIDIGGGTTDIAIVQNGGIMGTKMFAFGGRVFTRRIAKDMNIEMHDAEKMKIDYSTQKLHDATKGKVKKILENDALLWAESTEIALAEFEEIETFPSEFLICGGGAELPEIKESFISHPWLNVLPFERFPKITHIFPNQIENLVDKTGTMLSSSDVAVAALASTAIELIT